MKLAATWLLAVTAVCGAEMHRHVEKMFMSRTVRGDLAPSANGYIYRSDSKGPPSYIRLGAGAVNQHLNAYPAPAAQKVLKDAYTYGYAAPAQPKYVPVTIAAPSPYTAPLPVPHVSSYLGTTPKKGNGVNAAPVKYSTAATSNGGAENKNGESYSVGFDDDDDFKFDDGFDIGYEGKYAYSGDTHDGYIPTPNYAAEFEADAGPHFGFDFDEDHGHGHHGHGGHGHSFKSGGGHDHGADSHSSHGEKGDKGYKHHSSFHKGDSGHHFKDGHHGHYDHGAGHKSGHNDHEDHYSKHHKASKGHKGSEFANKKGHDKGSKTTGFHNVYHKDEFKKDHEFYDDAHHKGHFGKHHSGGAHHHSSNGAHHHGGNHDSAYHHHDHGKHGASHGGHHHGGSHGHSDHANHHQHYNHHSDYAKKAGHSDGSEHGYHSHH